MTFLCVFYPLETHEIFVSREVVFNEDMFPFRKEETAEIMATQHVNIGTDLMFNEDEDVGTLGCEIEKTAKSHATGSSNIGPESLSEY